MRVRGRGAARRVGNRGGTVLVLLILLTSGCAGPEEPARFGVSQRATNVVLGQRPSGEAPVLPAAPDAVALDGPFLPPRGDDVILPSPPPRTAAPKCRTASVFATPRVTAPVSAERPPAVGTYSYAVDGVFERGGANAQSGDLPSELVRSVAPATQAPDGTFAYDVSSTLGDVVTTVSYRLIPQAASAAGAPGLYVTSIRTVAGEDEATFSPSDPLLWVPFPAATGVEWDDFGVDTGTRTVLTIHGTVGAKRLVDACGDVLDAIDVSIDAEVSPCPATLPCPAARLGGQISTDNPQSFKVTSFVGTQFGGLSLGEVSEAHAEESGAPVYRKLESAIRSAPPQVNE